MKWHPMEMLPDGKVALLYQPADEEKFRSEGMIVGSLDRGWADGREGKLTFVNPAHISGWEMECEITHPTHWMELPDKP